MPRRGNKVSPKDFEPRKKNAVSLGSDSNIDNDFKSFRIGDIPTGLEFKLGEIRSTADNFVTHKETTGELSVTKIKGNKAGGQSEPQFIFQSPDETGNTTGLWFNIFGDLGALIRLNGSTGHFHFESDGYQTRYIGDDSNYYFAWNIGTLSSSTKLMSLEHEGELKLYSTADANDYFSIAIGSAGATTISTVDDAATAADLTLDVDGDIILDADGGDIGFKDGGNTFTSFKTSAIGSGNASLTIFENAGGTDFFKINCTEHGVSTISTKDFDAAAAHLTLAPDGELNFTPATEVKSDAPLKIKERAAAVADTAGYGQLWVKTVTPNELWFTDDAGNDIPVTLQPFVKTAQFQDDIGTSQHYIPFNNMFEQGLVGAENLGFIAPFNMKLQKVVIKCSEDISGATLEVGFWAIANGTTTHHHVSTNQQNVDVTGGTAHTNAIADFTGTVNDGTSSGGGSNAISAGQFVDLSIQADTDVTSSSAEFWITCYFLADLTATV